MRYILSFALMICCSFLLSLYMSWWSVAVVTFCISLWLIKKPLWAFVTGFLAILTLWGGLAWYISAANQHILAHKLAALILQKDDPMMLIALSGLTGAFTGGFAALSGSLLGRLLYQKNTPVAEA